MNELPGAPQLVYVSHPIVEQLNDYGVKLREAKQFAVAESVFRRCIAIDPKSDKAWSNLGLVLYDQRRHHEANDASLRSLELNPHSPQTINNMAIIASDLGRLDESLALFDKALELAPGEGKVLWNRTQTILTHGDWDRGLADYETRMVGLGPEYYQKIPIVMWDGEEDLNDKILYVQFEQGLGDRILQSRYVYWVKQKYPRCKILMNAGDKVNPLFWGFQQEGVATLLPEKIPFPKADLAIRTGTLMKFWQADDHPNLVPPDPGIILRRSEPDAKFLASQFPMPLLPALKVGICWAGNPIFALNYERSIPLELMLSLAELHNVALYSMQAGAGAKDVERIDAGGILQTERGFGASLEKSGMHYAAAILLNLDLFITVDTAMAHLAGALGVPTWLLIAARPFWLWGLTGDTTPWYPSMTLFRQKWGEDWKPTIARVKHLLKQEADELIP